MRSFIEEAGLEARIEVDSAGTSAFREGGEPDPRSQAAARERGVELQGPCRRFERRDFREFDYIIAMDRQNYHDLITQAPDEQASSRVALLRSFDPEAEGDEVPDPYIGADGFERVFDICHAGCRGLLDHLSEKHDLA